MNTVKDILTDRLTQEFLDRFEELVPAELREGAWSDADGAGGLESIGGGLQGGLTLDGAARMLDAVRTESAAAAALPDGLEAIIEAFGRPAYFVRNDTFRVDDTPSSSAEIDALVIAQKAKIDAIIPRVGRINLRNHAKSWVGTGWMVAPNVLVTNRHVAREFAEPDGGGFSFVESHDGRIAKADLDMYREHREPKESVFRLPQVRWIEPNKAGHHDVAFLEIAKTGFDTQAQPGCIELMSDAEFAELGPGRWLAIVGYPGFSPFNSAVHQQRIFQGVFDVKRMQPGSVLSIGGGTLHHDATTLGGNSGSVVLDLETGRAAALHFGGLEGKTNDAVSAPVVRQLLREKLGIELG